MKSKTEKQPWSKKDETLLKSLVAKNFSNDEIGDYMGRTSYSVSIKKSRLGITKPQERKTITVQKNEKSKVVFQIDNDWTPTRVFSNDKDSFLASIIETSSLLKPGQSFAIPYKELSTRYGWGTGTSGSLRHIFRKSFSSDFYGRIKIHEVRDSEKNLLSIRVRRVLEAE